MKNLVLLFILFFAVSIFGQEATYRDDFNFDSGNWVNSSANNSMQIKDGYLTVTHQKAVARGTTTRGEVLSRKSFDFTKDFDLETSYTTKNSGGIYVIWNYTDAQNFNYLLIVGSSGVQIGKREFGKHTMFQGLKSFNFLKSSYKRKVEIKKNKGKTSIIISGSLIKELDNFSISYKNSASAGIGLTEKSIPSKKFTKAYPKIKIPNTTLLVDYFSFNYTDNDPKDSFTKNQKEQLYTDKTAPTIYITSPNVNRGFSIVKNAKSTTIKGRVSDDSKIYEVLINGQEAYVDANGNFTKNVILGVGNNSFTVKATDVKMNSATKTFTIRRDIQNNQTSVTNNTKSNVISTGKYYALIIGNNTYKDEAISSLDEPIKDATKLYNVLTTKYAFKKENVTLLKNATYVETITAFDKLGNTLTANDNLLVFYAGHGWWDETKDLGYWLPTDARKSNTAFWIRNSTISDYMASIKTKHTLLIADACFSGSIFKTRAAFDDASLAIKKLNDLPSKTAMTSGNLKEVPDKSVFLKFLVQRLNENTDKYLPADKLFSSFRIAVMNNSPNAPQFGTIQNAGDEGGEFIFVKKN